MTIRIELLSKPDFGKFQRAMDKEIGVAVTNTAKFMVFDNTRRMKNRKDLADRPQKANTEPVQRFKEKHVGHSVPLRGIKKVSAKTYGPSDILSDPAEWTINGQRATGTIAPKKTADVSPPASRTDIIERLTQLGYRVPIGFSREVTAYFNAQMDAALRRAKARG